MTTYYKRNKLGGSISIFTRNDIGEEQPSIATLNAESYMIFVSGIAASKINDKLYDEDTRQFIVGTIGDMVA